MTQYDPVTEGRQNQECYLEQEGLCEGCPLTSEGSRKEERQGLTYFIFYSYSFEIVSKTML